MSHLEARAQALEVVAKDLSGADSPPAELEHAATLYVQAASTWRAAGQNGGNAVVCFRNAELCALRGAAVLERMAAWSARQAEIAVH